MSAAPTPARIGRYAITGQIGRGGFACVYAATDPTFGRTVAIKVLRPPEADDPDGPAAVKRFRAEAIILAKLQHAHILTVYEFLEEAGAQYLVMEYLEGDTLASLIRQNSLSLPEKLEIMSAVAEGLRYAHDRGVIHRDIKPCNIMRLRDGTVKVMDFGIAIRTAQDATRYTKTGMVVGTTPYMAPEQFDGKADAVSDIFEYGVTFYELLTGTNPFAHRDLSVVINRILHTDAPPLRSVLADCPEALDRLVARAMSRAREDRYSRMADVLLGLRPILLDQRRRQAATLVVEARQLLASGQLEAADQAVRKALELDPVHHEASQLVAEIGQELQRREAAARVVAQLEKAEEALAQGRWEEAASILNTIPLPGGADQELDARFWRAGARVEKFRGRQRRTQEAIAGIEELLGVGQAGRALESLAQMDADLPGSPEVPALRERAQRMQRLATVKAEAAVFLKHHEYDAALRLLQSVKVEAGDDQEVAQLWQAASDAKAGEEQPKQETRRPPEPPPRRKLPLGWSVAAVLALALAGVLYWLTRPPTLRWETPEGSGKTTAGSSFTLTLHASGGAPPIVWSTGSLPPGLSLDPSHGVIAGTPALPGQFDLRATATDHAGHSASGDLRIVVDAAAPKTNPQTNEKDGLIYVWIPPGQFQMGCSTGDNECFDQEKRPHQVTISKGFWMGQTEVTQEAYQKVTGKTPSHFKGPKRPVEEVTWDDARDYCQAAGMRLPTEAEWEYAARAGTIAARYGDLGAIAWYSENSAKETHDVGGKQPNSFGLYDMLGNVWEWVQDWYGPYSPGSVTDPSGPGTGEDRALRGGAWYVSAKFVRASGHFTIGPTGHIYSVGFRCAGNEFPSAAIL
ncbi:MAG TPA: SUMF1/EgtB/PvdO family nonheme iron enzyme [Bryobacteraceae bacterium]|nr:SUMF1/EgtB/PvdO family nonheme iron enzyme [Bryobacteraceae bacterium]